MTLLLSALDGVSRDAGRYIRLTNYCSGLCMPEIAAMGALERLDMMPFVESSSVISMSGTRPLKGAVYRRLPFTIILKVAVGERKVKPLRIKIDPGANTTGIAIVTDASGEVLFAADLHHRRNQCGTGEV